MTDQSAQKKGKISNQQGQLILKRVYPSNQICQILENFKYGIRSFPYHLKIPVNLNTKYMYV